MGKVSRHPPSLLARLKFDNIFNVGDTVELKATRPMSKTKRWRASKLISGVNK